jgi:hypothetical protein
VTPVQAIAAVLAQYPDLVSTNTPLEVLAAHMLASLDVFEDTLKARSDHQFYHPERRNAP